MKTVNIYDYVVIAGYFLFMLGIGVYFMRINKGGREYFAGGSMIPWWVSGMTLYMANFSAWSFTGAAGFVYTTGWFPLIWFAGGAFAYVAGTLLTGKLWRRTRSISPVEYTYTRFNVPTQQFLSWVISVNFTLSAGVQLASTCKSCPHHRDGNRYGYPRHGHCYPPLHIPGRALGGLGDRRRARAHPPEHRGDHRADEPV